MLFLNNCKKSDLNKVNRIFNRIFNRILFSIDIFGWAYLDLIFQPNFQPKIKLLYLTTKVESNFTFTNFTFKNNKILKVKFEGKFYFRWQPSNDGKNTWTRKKYLHTLKKCISSHGVAISTPKLAIKNIVTLYMIPQYFWSSFYQFSSRNYFKMSKNVFFKVSLERYIYSHVLIY